MAPAEPDFELQGTATIDEESFQDQAEGLQFEMQGDSEAVSEAQDMNEERNEKLGVISRSASGLVRIFSRYAIILAAILAVLAGLAALFDISFSDVRDAITQGLTNLVDNFKDLVSGEGDARERVSTSAGSAVVQGAGNAIPSIGLPGQLLNKLSGVEVGGETLGERLNINVLTSRDQMVGDSTQQDQETSKQNENLFNWGS